MKCDFLKGLYSEAAGGGVCGEGKINKTLLVPKNKPLRMVTPCYHVNGAGVLETCLIKRESWVKSCHGEKTQCWASSTLVTALTGCKQPGQVVDALVWVQLSYSRTSELTCVCVLIWFLMWVENKQGCLPISSFCKAGPLHSSFLVTLQHSVWNAAAHCGWG